MRYKSIKLTFWDFDSGLKWKIAEIRSQIINVLSNFFRRYCFPSIFAVNFQDVGMNLLFGLWHFDEFFTNLLDSYFSLNTDFQIFFTEICVIRFLKFIEILSVSMNEFDTTDFDEFLKVHDAYIQRYPKKEQLLWFNLF